MTQAMDAKILIIDDNPGVCSAIEAIIRSAGHASESVTTLKEGLDKVFSGSFDVIFLDVRLPDGNGLDALPEMLKAPCSPDVIIITGDGDPDGAELAINSGAWDYVEKPLSVQAIKLPLERCLQYRREKATQKLPVALRREGLIGESAAMKHCFDVLAQAAAVDAHVLITGETGTGKELFARAIHENSRRAEHNFVVVDCAALPETLVESILFGHVKGAFTGASLHRDGLVKQADGGTLFLDEVGELPMSVQRVFLRVLQERSFRPLGAAKEIESDFRLIAATNRDLQDLVRAGDFRQDLLFRLRAIIIDLPPLRERDVDVHEIARYHATRLCLRWGLETKGFSTDFSKALAEYSWPGNVRELANAMEWAISAASTNPTLFAMHLPTEIRAGLARASVSATKQKEKPKGPEASSGFFPDLKELLQETERQYLKELVSFTKGELSEILRISGLSRSRLYERLKKYNILLR